jgi:hypothetical protein
MEDNIDTIINALEEARRNLHQTVTEVNQKVATVSTQLQPERLVERHLLLAVCLAGALGFATGNGGGRPTGVATLLTRRTAGGNTDGGVQPWVPQSRHNGMNAVRS